MKDYDTVRNLPAMFFEQAVKYGEKDFLWAKRGGAWRSYTWNQTADIVNKLSRGLRALGVQPGDRVAVIAENRPEWTISDLAIMAAGGATVPSYTTSTEAGHHHVLSDSGAKIVILSGPALASKVLPATAGTAVHTVISMDFLGGSAVGLNILSWEEALAKSAEIPDDVDDVVETIPRDSMASIIYTSGTSAEPTGVMLSHGNMICNCMGAEEFLRQLPGYQDGSEVFLSFLPLSHSYEHTAGQFVPISIGAEIYYAEGLDKLVQNIVETRPTVMTAVPRLYENMRGRILRNAEKTGGLKEKLLHKAVEVGAKRYEDPDSLTFMDRLLDPLLDRLVRAKVRARFGGRLKAFVSGGGPLNYDVGLFFTGIGLTIIQGYGQTEASPVVSANRPGNNRIRTVGAPLKGVEVKIAEDGEILVRGELVMLGYWNQPKATERTIVDGWLHTGDIGVLEDDGYLTITDRKKDIIVNSGGDNVSPQRVEGILQLQPEIAMTMVHGDNHPHLVALIVPDTEFVREWRKTYGGRAGGGEDWGEIKDDPDFRAAISKAIDRANKELSVIEKVRRFIVADAGFSVENEMLTPSMKIRRHKIRGVYQDRLEALYRK